MRRLLCNLLVAFCLVLPARADEAAIRSVISSQIEAFLADDFEQAFSYASPSIKAIFGTSQNFGKMVREGYPMVWRPSDMRFLSTETIAGKIWQHVLLRDAKGVPHVLEYQMIEGEDGWKINAVRVRKAPEGSV